MVDSIQVFDPGFRVLDANGTPVNNAKIKFREAGPGATRTVYSDADLSVALGHTVRTRSDGYPVVSEGSSTTVLIYTGDTPYHIEITDEDDVAIFPAKDDVRGALDTDDFLTSADASVLTRSVVSKTGNYTVVAADKGKIIAGNPTGGSFTLTLTAAATLGDGWNIGILNIGSANAVQITAAENISTPMGTTTAFVLMPGETVEISCNGSTFTVHGYVPRHLGTVGVIDVADRTNTPPGSPAEGQWYILTSSPTGAWSSYAEHDLVIANGQGGWLKRTPSSDCGWLAYVRDEDAYYAFKGSAWAEVAHPASDTLAGVLEIAVQAEMEAASSAVLASTPGRQHFHPGHPKAMLVYDQATPAISRDYGVASVTDNGAGDFTVNFDTAFSAADYGWLGCPNNPSNVAYAMKLSGGTYTTTAIQMDVKHNAGTGTAAGIDLLSAWAFHGDQ